ncbi:MAG: hypothetical protein AAF572_11545 [Cyanobacteria bacterium P01_B01_bin.77]
MFFNTSEGAVASTLAPNTEPLPEHHYETVRHLVFGSLTGVRLTITNAATLSPTTGVNRSPPGDLMR